METYKINTLQKMLEQETLNMERLKDDPNNPSYKLSEANIKKLREQLRQVGVEVSSVLFRYIPISGHLSIQTESWIFRFIIIYTFLRMNAFFCIVSVNHSKCIVTQVPRP